MSTVPYAPESWTPSGADMHWATNLDQAFHHASCLSGGWYRRPVIIALRKVGPDEHYALVPEGTLPPVDFVPCYRVERLGVD